MLFRTNGRKEHSTRLRRRIRFLRRRWIRYSGDKTQRSTSWKSRKEQRNTISLHYRLSCQSVDSFVCSGSRYGNNKQALYWSCEILRETLIFHRRMMEHSNSLQFCVQVVERDWIQCVQKRESLPESFILERLKNRWSFEERTYRLIYKEREFFFRSSWMISLSWSESLSKISLTPLESSLSQSH